MQQGETDFDVAQRIAALFLTDWVLSINVGAECNREIFLEGRR
jgi:hypothetical protein